MELHDNKNIFLELVDLTRKYFGFSASHIEKDYWISKVLKELSNSEYKDNIFFKGGTSLSKAYHIINRFSEDLDLFVSTRDIDASVEQEKRLNKAIYKFIEDKYNNLLQEDLGKRGGNFNKAVINYEPMFSDNSLKKNLEIETKSCIYKDKTVMFYPSNKKVIESLIGQYLDENRKHDIALQFGLEAFYVQCLNPRKTICDKISRLARLSYGENPIDNIAGHIRDIYDLYSILQNEEYRKFVQSKDFLDGLYSVWLEDMSDRAAKTHLPLSKIPLFENPKVILSNSQIKNAYNQSLRGLMFCQENVPPIKNIEASLVFYEQYLRLFDVYREEKTAETRKRLSNVKISTTLEYDNTTTFISCSIDNEQNKPKAISNDDKRLIDINLLDKNIAALKYFRDELKDYNMSYENEITKDLRDKVVLMLVERASDCNAKSFSKKMRDYLLLYKTIIPEEKQLMEFNSIWNDTAQILNNNGVNKAWIEDTRQELMDFVEGKERCIGRSFGLK